MIAASGFLALNIFVFSITLYFNPAIFYGKLNFENETMLMLSQRFAAVFLALGISIIIALVMQSVSMLKLCMATYCIVTLQETILGFAHDDTSLMIRSFIFCVLAAFIVFISNGMKRKRKPRRFLKTQGTSVSSSDADEED